MMNTMNNDPCLYMTIHQQELFTLKIRKNYACITRIYTIDNFPIYSYIHQQASPSILVH
jgi:hypothetical protein